MHKIDGVGNSNNQFVAGNPEQGVLPTRLTPEWLNSLQGEISHVVTQSGNSLNKLDNTQLYNAITGLINIALQDSTGVSSQSIVASSGNVNINDGDDCYLVLTGAVILNLPVSGKFSITWVSGDFSIAINPNGKLINNIDIDAWDYKTANRVNFWFDAASDQYLCGN